MNLEPSEYQKIINSQQTQIDELCAVIHAIRGSKIANIAPFIARLVQERNELEVQRGEALETVKVLSKNLDNCQHLTKHFTIKSPN